MRDGGAAKETNKLGPASAASTPALQLQGAMALACALSAKLQRAAAGNPHGTGSLVDLHGTRRSVEPRSLALAVAAHHGPILGN